MRRITSLSVWTILALGVACTAAWADGDSRPATQAEKKYSLRMLTALSQALPRPLPGFEIGEAAEIAPFERVAPGCEAEPLRVYYSATWVNPEQAEKERAAEDEALARAVDKLKDPGMQAQQKAAMAKQEKLAAEFGKAIEKQDYAKAEKLQKEMEKLGRELENVGKAQEAVLQGETQALTKLSRLTIRMSVNDLCESQPARLIKEFKPMAGNPFYVYHDDEGKYEDCMTVLVGPWKKKIENEQMVYEAAKSPLPHTRAQTVMVSVTGDPSLSRRVLEGVNWKALQALLK